MTKPPLGLIPKRYWNLKRHQEVLIAIYRYLEEDYPIPLEWINEYNEFSENESKINKQEGSNI